MQFFRLTPLLEQLGGPGLTERDRFRYVMAWMLGLSVLTTLAVEIPEPWKSGALVSDFLITLIGVLYAWRRNGRDEGTAFLDRYFSVGWVVNFRTFVIVKVLFSVLVHVPGFQQLSEMMDSAGGFASAFAGSDDEPVDAGPGAFEFVVGTAVSVYVAWSIGRNIGRIRAAGGSPAGFVPAAAPAAFPRAAAPASGMDRFVESVVQRELAARPAERRTVRRSTIRPLRRRSRKASRRRR